MNFIVSGVLYHILIHTDRYRMMKEKILKLNDIKSANLSAVLDLLLQSDGLSRIELARKMGCDNTTVSRAVRELIDRGIVIPGEKTGQEHGRPRVMLRLNPDGPALIGISLEADRITGVLADLRGEIRNRDQVVFNALPKREEFLEQIRAVLRRLKQAAGERLTGIGVAVFGSYSGPDYVMENAAALPSLNGLNLRGFLEDAAETEPVICDHMVARMSFLTRKFQEFNTGTVMLISADSGIGSLISENGRFLFARNHHSGELGHTICIPDGPLCGCGRRGCLETVASGHALLQRCRGRLRMPGLNFEQLCLRFQDGDPKVVKETAAAAAYLGIAVSNQINSCPVDRLILTGRMLELGEKFQSMLAEKIDAIAFPSVKEALTLRFIRLDQEHSLARGAAIFAGRFSGLFRRP